MKTNKEVIDRDIYPLTVVTNMSDLGHWTSEDGPMPDDAVGFVYIIRNTVLNKGYVGMKWLEKTRTKKALKGKKKKRKFITESDWKSYTGSCDDINGWKVKVKGPDKKPLMTEDGKFVYEHFKGDMEIYGKEAFTFTIVKWSDSDWDLPYQEVKYQMKHEVLESHDWYNAGMKIHRQGKHPMARKHE